MDKLPNLISRKGNLSKNRKKLANLETIEMLKFDLKEKTERELFELIVEFSDNSLQSEHDETPRRLIMDFGNSIFSSRFLLNLKNYRFFMNY